MFASSATDFPPLSSTRQVQSRRRSGNSNAEPRRIAVVSVTPLVETTAGVISDAERLQLSQAANEYAQSIRQRGSGRVLSTLTYICRLLTLENDEQLQQLLAMESTPDLHQPSKEILTRSSTAAFFAAQTLQQLENLVLHLDTRFLRQLKDVDQLRMHAPALQQSLNERCVSEQANMKLTRPSIASNSASFGDPAITSPRHESQLRGRLPSSFNKAYDEFCSIMRSASSIAQKPKYRVDLAVKVSRLFADLTDDGIEPFASHFVTELLNRCDSAADILKELKEEVTPGSLTRINNLEKRLAGSQTLSTSVNASSSPSSSSVFTNNEVFFANFIFVADSHRFIISLATTLNRRLLELNEWRLDGGSVLSQDLVRNRLIHIKVLAKFLGFVQFGPFWPETGDQTRRQGLGPQEKLEKLCIYNGTLLSDQLVEALQRKTLTATLVWMIEFIRFIPSTQSERVIQIAPDFFRLLLKFSEYASELLLPPSSLSKISSLQLDDGFPDKYVDALQLLRDQNNSLTTRSALVITLLIEDLFNCIGFRASTLTSQSAAAAPALPVNAVNNMKAAIAMDSTVAIQSDSWLHACVPSLQQLSVGAALRPSPFSAPTATAVKKQTKIVPSQQTTAKLEEAFRWQHREQMSLIEFVTEKVVQGCLSQHVENTENAVMSSGLAEIVANSEKLNPSQWPTEDDKTRGLESAIVRACSEAIQSQAIASITKFSQPRIVEALKLLLPIDMSSSVVDIVTSFALDWCRSYIPPLVIAMIQLKERQKKLQTTVQMYLKEQINPPPQRVHHVEGTLRMLIRRTVNLLGATPIADTVPLPQACLLVVQNLCLSNHLIRTPPSALFLPPVFVITQWMIATQLPLKTVDEVTFLVAVENACRVFTQRAGELDEYVHLLLEFNQQDQKLQPDLWTPSLAHLLLRLIACGSCSANAIEAQLVVNLMSTQGSLHVVLRQVSQALLQLQSPSEMIWLRQVVL